MADGPIAVAWIELRARTAQLPDDVQAALDDVTEKVDTAADSIKESLTGAADEGAEGFSSAGEEMGATADETSGRIRSIFESLGGSIRDTFAGAAAESDASMDDMTASTGAATEESAGHFGILGKAMGAAFAGFAAVEVFKKLATAGEGASQTLAETTQFIRNTGGAAGVTQAQVVAMANALSASSGESADAVQQGENVLLKFGDIANAAGKNNQIFTEATQASVNMAAAMGTTAASAAAILGRALGNPATAAATLRREGVELTASQQAQIKSFVAAGESAKAQAVIMDAVGKTYDGLAAKMKTPGETMSAALTNIEDKLGTAVLPAVTKVVDALSGLLPRLEPVLSAIGSGLSTALDALAPVISSLAPIVAGLAANLAEGLGKELGLLVPLFVGLLKAIEPLLQIFFSLQQAILSTLIAALKPLVGPIVDIVTLLAKSLAPILKDLVPIFTDLGKLLASLTPVIATLLSASMQPLITMLTSILPVVVNLTTVLLNLITPVLVPLVDWFDRLLNGPLKPLLPLLVELSNPVLLFTLALGDLLTHMGGIVDFLSGIFIPMWNTVQQTFETVFSTIQNVTTTVIAWLENTWNDFVGIAQGIWNAITSPIRVVWNAIFGPSGAIATTWETLRSWLTDAWNVFGGVVTEYWNLITLPVRVAWNLIFGNGGEIAQTWDTVEQFLTSAWQEFSGTVSTIWTGITGVIGTLWNGLVDVAEDVWSDIKAAFTTGIDDVIRTVNTLFVDPIKDVFGVFGVHIPDIPLVGAAAGTAMSPGHVGSGFVTRGPTYLVGEGDQRHPEFVIPTDPAYRDNAMALMGQASKVMGLAHGGLIGDLFHDFTSTVGGIWSGIKSLTADAVDPILNTIQQKLDPVLAAIPPSFVGGSAEGMFNALVTGIETWLKGRKSPASSGGASLSGFSPTPANSVAGLAQSLAAARGWTGQEWIYLNDVGMRESGWSMTAQNPTSPAWGVAQFINGPSEYYTYGGSPLTALGQVTGMLNYIAQRYGTPANAWAHEESAGWYAAGGKLGLPFGVYDSGGYLPQGYSIAGNFTGAPEPVGSAGAGGSTFVFAPQLSVSGVDPASAAAQTQVMLQEAFDQFVVGLEAWAGSNR